MSAFLVDGMSSLLQCISPLADGACRGRGGLEGDAATEGLPVSKRYPSKMWILSVANGPWMGETHAFYRKSTDFWIAPASISASLLQHPAITVDAALELPVRIQCGPMKKQHRSLLLDLLGFRAAVKVKLVYFPEELSEKSGLVN